MAIMIYTLILTFIFSFFSRGMDEYNKNLASKYFIVITLCILVAVPAFRTNIGDTYVYKRSFESMGSTSLLDIFNDFGDVGYYVFTFYLYRISSNPQIMIFTTALITQVCYFKFFYKYRSYLELEIFMYITSGYFFVTMNGIRQSLAAGILVLATKYLIERNFKKYLLVVIFASLFHQSALIMILIYFIVRSKPFSNGTFIMIIGAIIGVMLFNELIPPLFKLLQGSNYEHYEQVFKDGTERGANILRVFVAMVPVILAYLRKEDLEEWENGIIFTNMAIINLVFMIFSLKTWIFARFTIYFNLYNFILLPYIIRRWINQKEKRTLYLFCILCYLLFFLVEQRAAERIKFFFINNNIFYNGINWFLCIGF